MSDTLHASNTGTDIHGPFLPEYRLTLDGYRVPYITVQPTDDGRFFVTADHRFGIGEPVTREELFNWLPILANAMAVAAGYSCHGANCRRLNPFATPTTALGSINPKPELTLVESGAPSERENGGE